MSPARTGRRDAVLLLFITLGAACWMVRAHWQAIDEGEAVRKIALHGAVLANEAPDPYQYKLWPITTVLEEVRQASGVEPESLFRWNTLLGVLWLLGCHALWLACFGNGRAVLVGTLTLVGLSHVLFLDYYHHPYEFWGVGLACLMWRGMQREWRLRALIALALVAGLVWEKHALLAPVYGFERLRRGDAFRPTLLRALGLLAACLVVPILIRLHLDGQLPGGVTRAHVDGDTPLHVQKWMLVLWAQGSYVLPFLAILALRFRAVAPLVRIGWIQLPLLIAAYLSQDYIVHEVRSFWALAPVFTATLVCWWSAGERPASSEGPSGPRTLATPPA